MIEPRCPQCGGRDEPPAPLQVRQTPDYCHLHALGNDMLDALPPGYRAIVIVLDEHHAGAASRDVTPLDALEVLSSHVIKLRDVLARTEVS